MLICIHLVFMSNTKHVYLNEIEQIEEYMVVILI